MKQVMSRCIDIFGERQVFTEASVNVMKNLIRKFCLEFAYMLIVVTSTIPF